MHLTFFLEVAVGYLIGSIPFAYLITRWKHGVDIRALGSGNVGARNVLDVTRDPSASVIVLVLDLAKGALPILVLQVAMRHPAIAWVSFAIVLGHCYPIWLKFKGGRGLATAAGILLVTSPIFLVIWLVAYWLSSKLKPQVHLNAFIALVVVGLLALFLPPEVIRHVGLGLDQVSAGVVKETVILLFVVLVSRHVGPVREYFRSHKQAASDDAAPASPH